MTKITSKLFESLKLTDSQAGKTIGGFYTAKDSDTSNSTTSTFDITFKTTNSDGSTKGTDTQDTGVYTTDQPNESLTPGLQRP